MLRGGFLPPQAALYMSGILHVRMQSLPMLWELSHSGDTSLASADGSPSLTGRVIMGDSPTQ